MQYYPTAASEAGQAAMIEWLWDVSHLYIDRENSVRTVCKLTQ